MNRFSRFFLPIALLLPLLGLGLIWWLTDSDSDQGTEWDVPIAGYDPRDLLRGHYVQFRYDWPTVREGDIPTWSGSRQGLCITGAAPRIRSVAVQDLIGPDSSSTAVCDATAKVNPWSEEGDDGLLRDRIYVPQDAAREYDAKLANPSLQGIVRIRINSSGFITPLSLRFQPRSDDNVDREQAE
ncbi:GDYXXLXY domain-containing protein [Parasphingorhabdus sp.]|uniref:GDYXXLXY domain-containing protein n=1 Tax=Parasphingorhabdus sp. TaxID=2709688 RepID=UPI0035948DEB